MLDFFSSFVRSLKPPASAVAGGAEAAAGGAEDGEADGVDGDGEKSDAGVCVGSSMITP